MSKFATALANINQIIYEPNRLIVSFIEEERQNSDYAAGRFAIFNKSVRFRVAKQTPNKVGQFVTFWEKGSNGDNKGENQPFLYEDAPELLVITTFKDKNILGQFVFPKEILLRKGILKSDDSLGKMGMRVYPSWDIPTSKTALQSQCWQLDYFFSIDTEHDNSQLNQDILRLYG